ncbi:quinone-dependent dihydroorotate dehydrogenase [Advenella mimigardefordensis]|uniref:Dihydroorotate dehydrogenase (quinone) n=1 Tax=Advenella mimigardefordensis (strain DSM 17166 / LMG 22922 / DPN7) TaxID=1247726 RepID=W0PCI1_ADVMD|nr:quinone-dependent dihydroorotate dehydrogenase [Advenella mimigardefordensis]AHG63135.1 dihydroorotate dehydrogenase [Advenella mimigardefordensis DPN7]
MSLAYRLYPLIRPVLFSMDPERAHERTLEGLNRLHQWGLLKKVLDARPSAPLRLLGLSLPNPVGLAAGLDKNGAYIDALSHMGFGFMEVGTVTPRAQPGNPKPRMFRLPQANALINRLGFNNQGLDAFLSNVANSEWKKQGGILGLNIGKNAATPIEQAADDYLQGLAGVYSQADYVTVNISSPNTQNLRALQQADELTGLLSALRDKRKELADKHGRAVPVVVKIAPDLDANQVATIAALLPQYEIDGVIATNTTLSRKGVNGLPHAKEKGGLSGMPVHEASLKVIQGLRRELAADFPIIGVGGIMEGAQAAEKVQAGANAIQLYTGLIYRGPVLVDECVKAIAQISQPASATT